MKSGITFVVFALSGFVLASPIAKVEPQIWKNLDASPLTNVLITFKKANVKAAYDRFYSLKLTSREAILAAQHAILKEHADIVQSDVASFLNKARLADKKHYLDQLWITNELIVRDVDREIVEKLEEHPDVETIVAEKFIPLEQMEKHESFHINDYYNNNTIQTNEWGVVNINAPAAWARGYTGTGMVIGNIDTGVRYTHALIRGTYRGNDAGENHNYNWRAPTGNAPIPSDTNGHGTHGIGTHSGTGGIGVAPNSRWIACRGCATATCSNFDLSSCGNFMACPTNTDGGAAQCSRAPHVVNNSWGGMADPTWYNSILIAWRNAGISGVFAIGNSFNDCASTWSPGNQPLAVGVGANAETNTLSFLSSVGPGPNDSIKPDVVAPGVSIVSAFHIDDTELISMTGTSNAAPHVTGAIALIRQARPTATVAAVHNFLFNAALPLSSSGRTCGGRSENVIPNYHAGHGRIDVNRAI